jgi:hypothetical protein
VAERYQPIMFPLGDIGFATDMPAQVRQLSHYTLADNVIFELSGAVRKVGGDARINSVAITGAPTVTGMFDFWLGGSAATFTQKFVVMTSDSKIYKDDMDGTYDDITGAATITANAIPVFCQARDLLLIFDNKNDTPLKWSQSGNVATLGGSPPAGRGATFHVNRVFTWGANANPSTLTYGSSTSVEDYTGPDTGGIDIDPSDGDRIVGSVSHKNRLFVFKGPNKGSIHVISGTAPTGSDAFSRQILTRGIALHSHNSIINVADDIWFMSDQGIHSLAATQEFGDFRGAYLSRYLDSYFRDTLTRTNLGQVWGCNYSSKSCALWVIPTVSSTTNNATLGISYRKINEGKLQPFTWSRSGASTAIRIHPTSLQKEVVFGNTAGFTLRQDQTARTITSNTAYNFHLTTPWVMTGEVDSQGHPKPYNPASLERMAMRSISTGNHDVTVTITSDMNGDGTYAFNQGANFTSGSAAIFDQTVFDTQVFDGTPNTQDAQFAFNSIAGEARAIKLDINQGGLNQDAYLLEICVEKTPTAYSEVS